jgi:hypothetical protein
MVISQSNYNIIVEALQDYKKWFEDKDDTQKIQDINGALGSLSRNIIYLDHFPVTYISKDDIIHTFSNNSEVKTIVDRLDDADMKHLASKLADDYCEQLFWESLKIIFESNFMSTKEET